MERIDAMSCFAILEGFAMSCLPELGVSRQYDDLSTPLHEVCPDWENWKKIHILTKNWSLRLILGSLEAKSEDLSEKIKLLR